MQIKKKTVQQKPIKHCKAIYPPIEKTNKNKSQKQVKKSNQKAQQMLDVLVGSFNVPLTWLVNILSHFVSLKPGLGGLIKLEIKRKSSSIFDAIKKYIYKS